MPYALSYARLSTEMFLRKLREDTLFWLARHMPRSLRYYAVIVASAEATTGKWSDTVVPELTVTDMLRRIEA